MLLTKCEVHTAKYSNSSFGTIIFRMEWTIYNNIAKPQWACQKSFEKVVGKFSETLWNVTFES